MSSQIEKSPIKTLVGALMLIIVYIMITFLNPKIVQASDPPYDYSSAIDFYNNYIVPTGKNMQHKGAYIYWGYKASAATTRGYWEVAHTYKTTVGGVTYSIDTAIDYSRDPKYDPATPFPTAKRSTKQVHYVQSGGDTYALYAIKYTDFVDIWASKYNQDSHAALLAQIADQTANTDYTVDTHLAIFEMNSGRRTVYGTAYENGSGGLVNSSISAPWPFTGGSWSPRSDISAWTSHYNSYARWYNSKYVNRTTDYWIGLGFFGSKLNVSGKTPALKTTGYPVSMSTLNGVSTLRQNIYGYTYYVKQGAPFKFNITTTKQGSSSKYLQPDTTMIGVINAAGTVNQVVEMTTRSGGSASTKYIRWAYGTLLVNGIDAQVPESTQTRNSDRTVLTSSYQLRMPNSNQTVRIKHLGLSGLGLDGSENSAATDFRVAASSPRSYLALISERGSSTHNGTISQLRSITNAASSQSTWNSIFGGTSGGHKIVSDGTIPTFSVSGDAVINNTTNTITIPRIGTHTLTITDTISGLATGSIVNAGTGTTLASKTFGGGDTTSYFFTQTFTLSANTHLTNGARFTVTAVDNVGNLLSTKTYTIL